MRWRNDQGSNMNRSTTSISCHPPHHHSHPTPPHHHQGPLPSTPPPPPPPYTREPAGNLLKGLENFLQNPNNYQGGILPKYQDGILPKKDTVTFRDQDTSDESTDSEEDAPIYNIPANPRRIYRPSPRADRMTYPTLAEITGPMSL